MGWNLFRRKALAAAAAAFLAAAAAPAQSLPGAFVFPRSLPIGSLSGGDLALPLAIYPIQGHLGEQLFALRIPEEQVVDGYVRDFLEDHRDWVEFMLSKLPIYRSAIAADIQSKDLPRELLFLPAVESRFDSGAVSRRGASGLWQLMPGTSISYGLKTDFWLDERRDFVKSTQAALKMLASYRRYYGDWYLALAAYNYGVANLTRRLHENGVSDYWSLRRLGKLPAETASFVPTFLAAAKILSYPGRYGFTTSWSPDIVYAKVPLKKSVDLRILARESKVPLETLLVANRELNMTLTPPASYGYQLKVPIEYQEAIERTLASDSIALIDFRVHTVKAGDTLYGVARTYGVTVSLLTEYNPGVKPQALKIGLRLIVPLIAKGSN